MVNKIMITGISGDIGFAIAKVFCQNGWIILGTYAHESRKINRVRETFKNVQLLKCDFSNFEKVNQLFSSLPEEFVPDVFVNNAGIVSDNFLSRMELSDWEQVLNVNLLSAIVATSTILNGMKQRKKGKIINLSSVSGVYGRETQSNYSTSKGGLIGLSVSGKCYY